VDPSNQRTRRLPGFFLGPVQLHAARHLIDVVRKLERYVRRFLDSGETPLYLLSACEVDGHRGLYGRDFFTRSKFRRSLSSLGMRFADDPFVSPARDQGFSCEGWASFRPEFVIHRYFPLDGASVARVEGAALIYWITTHRFGRITSDELRDLVTVSSQARGVNAPEPTALMRALRESFL
jgi:hypothetical protein